MIKTSRQLKALVRNKSQGDNTKALYLIRSYAVERFLERVSISSYKNNLVLKGGVLIASMIGIDQRFTMDVDTTLVRQTLSEENVRKIVEEIISIKLEDEMQFFINRVSRIMDESEYPGIRVQLDSVLETMSTPIKIDFSTGDVITPKEVEYKYPLLFEERVIPLMTYNVETMLAEKLETILSRGVENTRARDFYDVYILKLTKSNEINYNILNDALFATIKNRESMMLVKDANLIIDEIASDVEMQGLWKNYQRKFSYASDLGWQAVVLAVSELIKEIQSIGSADI